MFVQLFHHHRSMPRWLGAVLLAGVLFALGSRLAQAHPLGNFTINRYGRLELAQDQVRLIYVLDMAEIPTQQTITQFDQDGDGALSATERKHFLRTTTDQLAAKAQLVLNDSVVVWQLAKQTLEFPPGQADLPTLRLTAHFHAALPDTDQTWRGEFRDTNYENRLGWHELIVTATDLATLRQSDVPSADISNELRAYPDNLLQSPPNIHQANFEFTTVPGSTASAAAQDSLTSATNADGNLFKPTDRFAELITLPVLGPQTLALALLAAFGWGALHALSPGHGKTIVAAYLVGSRGTVRHALFLGLTTTITHTIGVFALGFVTLFLSRYLLPETLYPWLSFLSGLLVVLIGVSLFWGRITALLGFPAVTLDHTHEQGEEWSARGMHSHDGGRPHIHALPDSSVQWRNLLALGVSGGLIPCPSALVLMLGAISLQRVGVGLVLILCFSIGLASVLTALGISLVYAKQLFARVPESNRVLRVMPIASAALITLIGLGIAWQGLVQTGVFRLG